MRKKNSKNKIFRRKRGGNISSLKISDFESPKDDSFKLKPTSVKKEVIIAELVKETLFNTFEHPYVVVNKEHDILEVSGDLRLFLSLSSGTIPVNLSKMVNPEIQLEVRTLLTKAVKDRSSLKSKIKKFDLFGDLHYVRVTAKPLIYTSTSEELFVVIFEKLEIDGLITSDQAKNEGDFENNRVNELEEELASTKEDLQTYITEQNKMQKLLEETQKIAKIGAWDYDLTTKILSVTPTIREIFGIGDDVILDIHNGLEFYKAGKSREQISKSIEKCLSEGSSFDLELELVSADGEEKWVRSLGNSDQAEEKITRIYGSIQDITSVKEMEHQMASVSNNIPGAVFRYKLEKDGSDSIFLLNDGSRVLWGLEPEAVMEDSKLVWEMIHPDDLSTIAYSLRYSSENLTRWLSEWRVILPTGEIHWHQGTGNPEKTIDGGTIWDVVVLDISNVKLAEQSLEKTNSELRKILESSMDVICSIDASGRFISISAACKTVFGYDPYEIIGKPFITFLTAETKEKTEKIAQEVMGGLSVTHFENEYHRKDGTHVPLIWSARWVEEEQLMFCIARDATDLKEAQKQVLLKEKLLNEAQILAKMGSWNFDFYSSKLTWTDSLFAVFGTNKETFKETPDSFLDLVDSEDKELVRSASEYAQKSGKPFNIEYKITTPSGEKRVIEEFGYSEKDASGAIIRLYGTAQNITERKQAQREIKASHQRFIYATQATSDVIWDWNVSTGQVIWGENYQKVFGLVYDTGKSDEENVQARIHPDEIEEVLTHAVKTIKSRETTWWFEHRYLKADGSYAHVSNKALIVRNESGKATRVIGAMQDISQNKQEEQRLKLMEKVITNTNDAIVITNAVADSDNGPQILYINEAFSRVTGYTPIEIIGKSPSILKGPNTDKEDIQKLNQAIQNREHFEVTLLNYKKDGQEFWNNLSIAPVSDSDGAISNWISIQRDVTAQKHEAYQNQLLDEISEMFSLENKLIPTLVLVLSHLAEFGHFDLAEAWLVSADRKKINLLGKTHANGTPELFYVESGHQNSFSYNEGIPGYVWKTRKIEIWDKVDSKIEFARKAGALNSGLNAVLGLPLVHNDILLGVLVFGSRGNANELLAYKTLFQKLETFLGGEIRRKQLEEELKNLFNTAPDIICISGLDGYFKKINPAACALLEYSEEELLSIPFMELVHPEDREKTANHFLQLPSLKQASYFENRYLTKSCKTIWLAWSITPSSEEELIFSVAKDMTIQKTLQNLLDSAISLAKIGGWEMVVGSEYQTWSKISLEIHEVDGAFQPTLEKFVGFYREDFREQVQLYLLNCIEHGIPFDFEYPILTSRKNEKWIRTIGNGEMREGKVIRIYGSFQDIHDRKHAENELLLAYEEKNTILESIGDAFYSVDNEWTVTYWNKKAEEFLGIKKETILNHNLWDVVKETYRITLFDKFLEIKTIARNLSYEHYYEHSKVWYSINAYPNTNGISVYFKDITQRKIYVEQIRESNERFEIVTQATNDAIWDYNAITGKMYHGEGYRTLFGYKPGVSTEGQAVWEEKIHPDDRERLKAYFKDLSENPKVFDLYSEYKYKRADGSYAYVIDRGIILRDKSGKVTRMIGATQDVTERNHYEKSLKELNEKLEKHAKELALSNAELEQFAYVASHDLQEPLRMVTSFLTQLDKKYNHQLDEKAHQYIEFAVDGARRMRQIILDLLDFSRIGKHEDALEEISLRNVVSEVLKLQGKLVEETGAQFQIGDLPSIGSFRSPIVQIFQNLIGNALKYRRKDTPPVIRINAVESEIEWLFSIEDNGIGIEKEYFERVFIIFKRLHSKKEYSGTGMGLAIVKKILENLGGKIWVNSKTGVGSTFYFTLPK
ncbi:MAG TPA: PAS domain S-box protein [Lunatimonas sp.]|nr:PAS domain S-box protein [Lunatimonas sp.]